MTSLAKTKTKKNKLYRSGLGCNGKQSLVSEKIEDTMTTPRTTKSIRAQHYPRTLIGHYYLGHKASTLTPY